MTWRDFSGLDEKALALLPERFALAARWTKHMPLEHVLTMDWQRVIALSSQFVFNDDDKIIVLDRFGAPCAVITSRLNNQTLDYMNRLGRGTILEGNKRIPFDGFRDSVFRGLDASMPNPLTFELILDGVMSATETRNLEDDQ